MALWSVLNHPEMGVQVREVVSSMLRRDGKAHITWHYNPPHGLAITVGERFVDLEATLKAAPADRQIIVAAVAPEEAKFQ